MPVISFTCLLILSIFLLSGFRKNADFLSPGRIFIIVWVVVIGLVEFKFSKLQISWGLFDWFMVLIGLVTFLMGIYISFTINLHKPFFEVSKIRTVIRETEINENKLFKFIVVYFLVCLISFILEWKIEGYIPLFTDRPDKARVMFGVFGLHYIVNSVNVVLFFIIQYFIFIKAKIKKKAFLTMIFILSLGNYVLFVQRYLLFILIMMAFCLFYYSGKRIRLRTLLIFISILFGLIVGIQSIRETELIKYYIMLDSKMKFSPKYAEFAIPYMYISMNLENFVKYYSQIKHSYGFFTFDFFTELTITRYWISHYFDFDKTRLHIGGYNTFPFYWPYFYDFGIAGLVLIPFIIGFVFSEIYYFLHRNPNLVVLTIYTVVFSVISISFSSDPLVRLDTMLNFIIIIFVQFIIVNKIKKI
jgi:oligosaccharide repeat unit polymerase